MIKMTKLIGLTGGIATGKSTVSKLLATKLPIVDADKIAWQVEGPGQPTTQKIVAHFGQQAVLADGRLNRPWLGQLVFNDAQALQDLTAITRLPIQYAMFEAIVAANQQQPDAIILDVPLLFESGWQHVCDQVLVVTASPAVVLQRLMARNHLSQQAAQARIDSQMPLAQKVARADVVIDNGANIDKTKAAVLKWLKTITK
ncbi:dephospho-CoA kinase [Lactiplantibacillus plantarum subsp. plantarum ATCC 14917 = JCM 1149 = CGMCC 1.2437]|nr:dephospho-CoA kinase [Lactiplantibacillus plantarum ST-III]EFK30130.1 dephospho-CoA kinase [Lactiplantibacillus plantarum subsp. plantarum ATCC 14917 = JCM 1149 = CGMCC 1.2437]EHS82834.1 dephospho-CoA kinase [Lactiplantibacillus plantarum subsp. plantarum NC8]KRL34748.1 dephospho-CoA kinase [Lactiplantibacillus plantarum subsp. plantarum ATCC 14917 = JCM 1149 = CGMCC 1.2437]KRN36008.1 dephospho-CoA kinase [Lactiplantibacillus plantarum]